MEVAFDAGLRGVYQIFFKRPQLKMLPVKNNDMAPECWEGDVVILAFARPQKGDLIAIIWPEEPNSPFAWRIARFDNYSQDRKKFYVHINSTGRRCWYDANRVKEILVVKAIARKYSD